VLEEMAESSARKVVFETDVPFTEIPEDVLLSPKRVAPTRAMTRRATRRRTRPCYRVNIGLFGDIDERSQQGEQRAGRRRRVRNLHAELLRVFVVGPRTECSAKAKLLAEREVERSHPHDGRVRTPTRAGSTTTERTSSSRHARRSSSVPRPVAGAGRAP